MSIRVIAGSAKGRRLKRVPGDTTRPVMDRVKEALFSIIGRRIYDARFLDLFAGTGSVGIEALSRGAASALLVDNDRRAIQTIYENLQITSLSAQATVRRADAFAVLKGHPEHPYDFIYIAPPQYAGLWLRAVQAVDANPGLCAADGTVIVQIDPSEQEAVTLQSLTPVDERRYGNTLLWFFEVIGEAVGEPPPEENNSVLDSQQLEAVVRELIANFEITSPPIPIESLLQHPQPGMWEEIDINQLSGSFLKITEPYAPRMSLARLLVRHIITSPWGGARGLVDLHDDDDQLHAFARMLMMPADMVMALGGSARTPDVIAAHFEVPEADAKLRLEELATYSER
ncbi:MAG: 16S rRNA (guanine(966)-N(2))-methyltransferase RsmD [Chloroflexi bacterium]|nr:16S rRNA (guanine(966)-N(2))-methyltransferase RsmD [Chloroflexota bacterium]